MKLRAKGRGYSVISTRFNLCQSPSYRLLRPAFGKRDRHRVVRPERYTVANDNYKTIFLTSFTARSPVHPTDPCPTDPYRHLKKPHFSHPLPLISVKQGKASAIPHHKGPGAHLAIFLCPETGRDRCPNVAFVKLFHVQPK
jgi:hypothetical protein